MIGAVALTAAFLYTAGTSRAGEVTLTGVDATLVQQRHQLARTHSRAARRLLRQQERALRAEQREAQRAAERSLAVAAWTAAATPPFRCPASGPVQFVDSWGDARSCWHSA